ncbi:MAG: NINE protein [Mycobacterium sp.]|jgi:TM2 domain-containing membrane protein YozV
MTEPPFGGSEATPPPYQPPPQYQAPPNYPPPPGQYPPPYPPPGYYMDPMAPYGRNPLTGEPLSDKSKIVGGLLQLLGLVGVLGIGRIYLGYTTLGIAQLIVGLIGGFIIGMLTCGIGFAIPVIWGIIDAVLILTGQVRDPLGRPLRDG